MKKDMIAVCDSEAGYAGNFAEYLNARKKLPFRAEAFTDSEKLCQYAGKNCPKFLLIAEEDLCSQIENLHIPNLIILSSDKDKKADTMKYVYKYQSAESLIREVMSYCGESFYQESAVEYKKKLQVAGVYSPLGRCGKTLFALTAGQIWGEDKETLYINMEDFSGWIRPFCRESSGNLSDFFYLFRQNQGSSSLAPLIGSWGNLDYLSPLSSPEDLRSISFKEWVSLFRHVEKETKYQLLVLDIGNAIDQLFSVLEACNRIYMPVLEDWFSQCKLQQFREMADSVSDCLRDNILELHLPIAPWTEKSPDFPQDLLWGKWGTAVRKILEEDSLHGKNI